MAPTPLRNTVRDQPELAWWGFLAIHWKEDRVIHQDCNHVHLDPHRKAFVHGATLWSNNTGKVTAVGEALEWIRQQPLHPELSYKICLDSYYAIDCVGVTPERNSAHLRNGVLLRWAHDSLSMGRAAWCIIRFCKVQGYKTDNSIDCRRNDHANKLANNHQRTENRGYPCWVIHGTVIIHG